MKRRSGYNPKRKIAGLNAIPEQARTEWTERCAYTGNPQHKRNPMDYGLAPPASPRPGKTLCDAAGAVPKKLAQHLLVSGITKGMVNVRQENGWPQNVWAVGDDGEVFEAQLENREQGTYHGYPMPADDDFRASVVDEWKQR